MELQIDIDEPVIEWLASMGYPVAGMPSELLGGMLLREARQWQLSPELLRTLIDEGAKQTSGSDVTGVARADALRPHRARDRFASTSI